MVVLFVISTLLYFNTFFLVFVILREVLFSAVWSCWSVPKVWIQCGRGAVLFAVLIFWFIYFGKRYP